MRMLITSLHLPNTPAGRHVDKHRPFAHPDKTRTLKRWQWVRVRSRRRCDVGKGKEKEGRKEGRKKKKKKKILKSSP